MTLRSALRTFSRLAGTAAGLVVLAPSTASAGCMDGGCGRIDWTEVTAGTQAKPLAAKLHGAFAWESSNGWGDGHPLGGSLVGYVHMTCESLGSGTLLQCTTTLQEQMSLAGTTGEFRFGGQFYDYDTGKATQPEFLWSEDEEGTPAPPNTFNLGMSPFNDAVCPTAFALPENGADGGTEGSDGTTGGADATDGTTGASDATDGTDGTTGSADAADGTTGASDATDGTTGSADATDGTTGSADAADGTTGASDATDGITGASDATDGTTGDGTSGGDMGVDVTDSSPADVGSDTTDGTGETDAGATDTTDDGGTATDSVDGGSGADADATEGSAGDDGADSPIDGASDGGNAADSAGDDGSGDAAPTGDDGQATDGTGNETTKASSCTVGPSRSLAGLGLLAFAGIVLTRMRRT